MTQRAVALDPVTVRDRLVEVVGSSSVEIQQGVPVAAPETEDETAALMRVAGEEGWRLLPRGAGLEPGAPRSGPHSAGPELIVSSSRLTDLLDHEPGDLNVRVGAGLTLGALQTQVALERQWLALDPPGGHEVTVGGVVSAGVAGPLRAQYGRPRDHLLGLTLVDGGGRILELGGRVVKNVAGFDLVRLASGGRGALGMITQVTFRLHPQPEEDLTLIWDRPDMTSAWELGRELVTLPIPLASAELVAGGWPSPLDGGGVHVLLRLTGSSAANQRTLDLLVERAGAPDRELRGRPSVDVSVAVSVGIGATARPFRLHALPSHGGDLLASLSDVPCERVALHLLGGTCRGGLSEDATTEAVSMMGSVADRLGGTLWTVDRVEGTEPGSTATQDSASKDRLRAEIIRAFDPSGLLPGTWRSGWISTRGRADGRALG